MSDSKNLMGLNLSVDNELIAEAAKEAIIAGIASAMSNKEQIVHEFVKATLTERVLVEDGRNLADTAAKRPAPEWNGMSAKRS